ncbi:MAG: phage capsid protein [Desulfovibrionaceae bacterium]
MSIEISQHFITEYTSQVHLAYQARGSKLRKTVRLVTGVNAADYVFQKAGKGSAGKKTRDGKVPLMNAGKSTVKATLEDWYAADYVDELDRIKTSVDEIQVAAQTGANAVGRKADEMLIAKMAGAAQTIAVDGSGLTKAKVLAAFKALNEAEVPDDGQRFAVVGPNQWNELLNLKEFKSSDYVGEEFAWLKGTESRRWLGFVWIMHNSLPLSGGNRTCYLYHKSALGLAEGVEIKAHIDWVPDHASHLVDHCMSAGAVLIDSDGVVGIACDDDAEIAD